MATTRSEAVGVLAAVAGEFYLPACRALQAVLHLGSMSKGIQQKWQIEIEGLSRDKLLKRWEKDFDCLSNDVHRIHWNREVFQALNDEIVRAQREGSDFFLERFLRPMYLESQSILLRRLGDSNRRSSSFRVLLEEMILRPELLTRDRYVAGWAAQFGDDPDYLRVGNEEFSTMYGARARRVPRRVLEQYRNALIDDLVQVKTFVDQFVAHQDRVTEQPITWTELNRAIDNLQTHLNAVGLIVTGYSTLAKATVNVPWRNVFGAALFEPTFFITAPRCAVEGDRPLADEFLEETVGKASGLAGGFGLVEVARKTGRRVDAEPAERFGLPVR